MSKPVGPTFMHELAASGLGALPIRLTADRTVDVLEPLSAEATAILQAVLDAHDPSARLPGSALPPRPEREQPKEAGPTFRQELASARHGGLPLAFRKDGHIVGLSELSDVDYTAVCSVLAAHDPTKPAPLPVPEDISRRQFFQALAKPATAPEFAVLTEDQAEAALFGVIPDPLAEKIDGLQG